MARSQSLRTRIRDYFINHPNKQLMFQEILKQFGTSQNNISTHLKALRDCPNHWLSNPRRGLWELNPQHKTDEQLKQITLEAGQRRVVATAGFQHGKDTLTPTVVNTKYWHNHMQSILERMKRSDLFVSFDLECVTDLMESKWPSEGSPLRIVT